MKQTNTQHTPGPWHVMADPVWTGKHPLHEARFVTTSPDVETFGHPGEPDEDRGWRFANDDAVIICTMPDAQNQKANARLIAAAPELLAALQRLTASADSVFEAGKEEDRLDGSPLICEGDLMALNQARAAIAKAKGTV